MGQDLEFRALKAKNMKQQTICKRRSRFRKLRRSSQPMGPWWKGSRMTIFTPCGVVWPCWPVLLSFWVVLHGP